MDLKDYIKKQCMKASTSRLGRSYFNLFDYPCTITDRGNGIKDQLFMIEINFVETGNYKKTFTVNQIPRLVTDIYNVIFDDGRNSQVDEIFDSYIQDRIGTYTFMNETNSDIDFDPVYNISDPNDYKVLFKLLYRKCMNADPSFTNFIVTNKEGTEIEVSVKVIPTALEGNYFLYIQDWGQGIAGGKNIGDLSDDGLVMERLDDVFNHWEYLLWNKRIVKSKLDRIFNQNFDDLPENYDDVDEGQFMGSCACHRR